jgi:hypothetical protein
MKQTMTSQDDLCHLPCTSSSPILSEETYESLQRYLFYRYLTAYAFEKGSVHLWFQTYSQTSL